MGTTIDGIDEIRSTASYDLTQPGDMSAILL